MSGVKRVFVEKKKPFAVNAKELHDEITGYLGIKTITDKLDIDDNIKNLMIDLPYLFGGEEVFKKAYVDGLNEESKNALDNLKRIYELLCLYGFEKYVSIDLGMLESID